METPRKNRPIAGALASAFLAGAWTEDAMVARGAKALEPRPRWLRKVVRGVRAAYHRPPLDRPRELAAFVGTLLPLNARARVITVHPAPTKMLTRRWPVPVLDDVEQLADLLELDVRHLVWLADARGIERRTPQERLRNYRYDWLPRRKPDTPPRVIERPKRGLKAAQRHVLHEILNWIPAHDAAHGFVPGRSVHTHAGRHVGRDVVVRFDVEDFFASVSAGRVFGIFRTAGYPDGVAHTLTALCTNVVPQHEWAAVPRPERPAGIDAHHRLGRRLATPHLPQGAPTSPALANLACHRLDTRLTALADRFGATYSRYADDLTFSGDHRLTTPLLRTLVGRIVPSEGFVLNEAKTSVVTRAGRQRVTGIVINERPNVARDEYDALKALLHNAARTGPEEQNRAGVEDFRAHVQGRIAWIASVNPARGARLRARFDQIAW